MEHSQKTSKSRKVKPTEIILAQQFLKSHFPSTSHDLH